jgi:hypothetical protein
MSYWALLKENVPKTYRARTPGIGSLSLIVLAKYLVKSFSLRTLEAPDVSNIVHQSSNLIHPFSIIVHWTELVISFSDSSSSNSR